MSGLPLRPNCGVHFTTEPIISDLTNVQLPWAPASKHWRSVKPSWEPEGHYFFSKVHIFQRALQRGFFFFNSLQFHSYEQTLPCLCGMESAYFEGGSVSEAGVSQPLQY